MQVELSPPPTSGSASRELVVRGSAPARSQPAASSPPLTRSDHPADTSSGPLPGAFIVSYRFTEQGRHLYFQVIDEETGEVLRQVPPDAVLNEERRIAEYLDAQAKLHASGTAER